MGLAGNLETMALPEILQWVSLGRKTGTLKVTSDVLQKRVVFLDGVLVSSSSNDPGEALGQFLMRGRLVNEEQIFNGLLRQEKEGRLLGEILIDEGVLQEEDLSRALSEKAAETVYDLFLWKEGAFAFEEQENPDPVFHVEMDVHSVIMEGVRRIDEWERIRKVFPSQSTTFTVKARPPDADASAHAALDLAEGGKSLREIALELRRSEFEAAALLFELHSKGALKVERAGEPTRPSNTVTMIQEEIARANRHIADHEFDAARERFENVLALDRLNQDAKKGLVAVVEARHRHKALEKVEIDKVPVLKISMAELTKMRFDPQEGFVLSRVNGEWSVASILKTCLMGEDDALLIFSRLLERGVIELQDV